MPDTGSALRVEAVTVVFNGIVALDRVSINVGAGEIVGMLGPNGAGKTTLLNVVSGHTRSASGQVQLWGQEVSALPSPRRARMGVGRTYQDGRLFPGLTVREVLQLGLARTRANGFIEALLGSPWVRFEERALRARADEVIEQFGLVSWADTLLGHLSTGTRRACDLAIQVAAGSRLLLLDEPTAGLAQRESEEVGGLLRSLRDDVGCSVLVVDHDVPFLMGLTHRLYALEAGRVIFDGPPAQMHSDPAVIASYLGAAGTQARRPRGRGSARARALPDRP